MKRGDETPQMATTLLNLFNFTPGGWGEGGGSACLADIWLEFCEKKGVDFFDEIDEEALRMLGKAYEEYADSKGYPLPELFSHSVGKSPEFGWYHCWN